VYVRRGAPPQFANPNGSVPAIDPMSLSNIWFLPSWGELARQQKLLAQVAESSNFRSPRRYADISDAELGQYAGRCALRQAPPVRGSSDWTCATSSQTRLFLVSPFHFPLMVDPTHYFHDASDAAALTARNMCNMVLLRSHLTNCEQDHASL
jgi:hypothetical protein